MTNASKKCEMNVLTCALARLFLPTVLALNTLTFVFAHARSLSLELAVTASSVLTLVAAWMLQRYLPQQPAWNRPHLDNKTDYLSMAVIVGVLEPLLKIVGVATAVWLAATSSPLSTLFPSQWPFALQVVLAVGLLELGKYGAHRLHHAVVPLWWLHAMHHSPQRMTAANNFRLHPLNYAINFCLSILPMLLIGIPAEVMWAYLAITQPIVLIQHANLNLHNPWLDRWLATPRSHLWHHDADAGAGQLNFGSSLLLWDHVFGTYRSRSSEQPAAIGLYAGSKYPTQASYFDQLRSMFGPDCCPQGGRA